MYLYMKIFNNFLQEKKFDDENQYFCNVCKHKVQLATSRVALWKLPKFLIINLKRYYNKSDSKELFKSDRNIEFPLDFDPMFLIDNKKRKLMNKKYNYKLHSGVFHMGNLYAGHYNCFSWNQDTNEWLGFDDESKMVLDGPFVKHRNIYQLVYQLDEL